MNVEIVYRSDPHRPLTDPLPESNGLVFRLVRGDLCDPMNGRWFDPPFPTKVIRWRFETLPLPFVAWKLGKFRGYLGAKVYGVDSEHYLNWLPASEVYTGSQAFCLSARMSLSG